MTKIRNAIGTAAKKRSISYAGESSLGILLEFWSKERAGKKLEFRVRTPEQFCRIRSRGASRRYSTEDSNYETVTIWKREGNLSCLRAMFGSFRIDRPHLVQAFDVGCSETSAFPSLHDAE